MTRPVDPDAQGDETASFAPEPASISAARRYATHTLADWGVGREVSNLASLIVSELAANAVLHAHSDFEVNLTRHDDSVRIGVTDASTDAPVRREPGLDSQSGYGLMIVDKISTGWGWTVGEDGKEIWVYLKT